MNGLKPVLANASDAIFRAALASPYGICVHAETLGSREITSALRAKQVLYRYRQESGVREYRRIQVRLSLDNPSSDLWLIKYDEELPGNAEWPGDGDEPDELDDSNRIVIVDDL